MANLAERQAAERESLERLSDALDKRAHDLESLVQVLAAARDFSSLDPVEHVRAALRQYVREQSHPVPEGYVLVPANLTTDMVRAFALETVGRWDSTTEAEKQEVAEKLQIAFDAMLAAAPKPGGDDD